MGVPKLPRLKTGLGVVDSQGNATQVLIQQWNALCVAIEGALGSQQSQITAIQTQNAQILAALQQANNALTVADAGGGSPGSVSGSQTVSSLTITPTWTHGPLVNLAGVSADHLTFTPNFSGSELVSAAVNDSGQYRLQEIIGGVETTVFTGDLQIYSYPNYTPAGQNGFIAVVGDLSTAAWSAFSLARASTGAVGYRLDFDTGSTIYLLDTAYLFARRAT